MNHYVCHNAITLCKFYLASCNLLQKRFIFYLCLNALTVTEKTPLISRLAYGNCCDNQFHHEFLIRSISVFDFMRAFLKTPKVFIVNTHLLIFVFIDESNGRYLIFSIFS